MSSSNTSPIPSPCPRLRYLFFMTSAAGNQPPAIAIGQRLRSLGHEVIFVCFAMASQLFESAGFKIIILPQSGHNVDPSPPSFFKHQLVNPLHLQEIPQLIAEHQPQRVIIDELMYGALAAGEKGLWDTHTIPLIVYCHCTLSGWKACAYMGVLNIVNGYRSAISLPAVGDLLQPFKLSNASTILIASIPELEVENEMQNLDHTFKRLIKYIGPHIPKSNTPSNIDLPWSIHDPRPLILANFSSGVMPVGTRIHRCVAALSDASKYRMLCTYNKTSVDDLLNSLPENICLIQSIPHTEIIDLVSAIITHAGHGTVGLGLTYGKPMVCLPMYGDQFTNSRQVVKLDAGITLDGETATPSDIRAAVDTILTDHKYSAGIQAVQRMVHGYHNVPLEICSI